MGFPRSSSSWQTVAAPPSSPSLPPTSPLFPAAEAAAPPPFPLPPPPPAATPPPPASPSPPPSPPADATPAAATAPAASFAPSLPHRSDDSAAVHHGHQFHLFQQEQQRRIHQQLVQLGLDHDSGPENSTSPTRIIAAASGGGGAGISPFLSGVDFKLGVNDSIEIHHIHPWTTREDSNIKEPFWRPLDIDYSNRNSKRCKEKQPDASNSASNFKLFSEFRGHLQAHQQQRRLRRGREPPQREQNQQTGSGSVLTGENPPAISTTPRADYGHNTETADQGSDSSTGEEAAQIQKPTRATVARKETAAAPAELHRSLHGRPSEKADGAPRRPPPQVPGDPRQERPGEDGPGGDVETAGGRQATSEAMAKAQDQALAPPGSRHRLLLGEDHWREPHLPTREQFHSPPQEETLIRKSPSMSTAQPAIVINPSRWPKAEVQALIQVRSNLESRFQEPGLKGPLWEEVSSAMAAMGYQRGDMSELLHTVNGARTTRPTKRTGLQ
ncbi:unnamed protein product [Spirodela intermedia]|uniref:Myb/SANT-like DNA-binding domain-containing protein n=1 Tax=Spirodela intermedia TaxID=51605 RepID=A0A7I8JJ53_SPIIN|nr:unnamed protein product [Spirodela intermedia]CAA6669815.1 unnamed protein product [Spirodela intermedia]